MFFVIVSCLNELVWLVNDIWLLLFNGIELYQVKCWLSDVVFVEMLFVVVVVKVGKIVFFFGQQGILGNSFELGVVVDIKVYCVFLI